MYRIVVILGILSISSRSVQAQLDLRLLGGLNLSTSEFRSGTIDVEIDATTDYFVGLSPQISLGDRLAIAADVLYSRRGFAFASRPGSETRNRYHFIDVIPHLRHRLVGPLSVTLGLQIGIKLDEEVKLGDEDWLQTSIDQINTSDFGLNVGLQLQLGRLAGFVRYNHGLADVLDLRFTDENGVEIGDVKQYLQFWQIGLGYSLW